MDDSLVTASKPPKSSRNYVETSKQKIPLGSFLFVSVLHSSVIVVNIYSYDKRRAPAANDYTMLSFINVDSQIDTHFSGRESQSD